MPTKKIRRRGRGKKLAFCYPLPVGYLFQLFIRQELGAEDYVVAHDLFSFFCVHDEGEKEKVGLHIVGLLTAAIPYRRLPWALEQLAEVREVQLQHWTKGCVTECDDCATKACLARLHAELAKLSRPRRTKSP